jgi:hypothetical protein
MSTPRYADLTWDQIKASPAWEGLSIEGRVQLANDYHADVAGYLQESGEATDESLAKVNAARRARIFEVAPSLKQPEDIGVMENVSNAFTKSMSSFKENIYYNLLEQNPEEAARYRTALEREYPTAPGFSEKVGRITGMMLPSGAALLSAPDHRTSGSHRCRRDCNRCPLRREFSRCRPGRHLRLRTGHRRGCEQREDRRRHGRPRRV